MRVSAQFACSELAGKGRKVDKVVETKTRRGIYETIVSIMKTKSLLDKYI